jgi:hypothetical protein
MNPMKRTSLIVYEADIFKCSQHSARVKDFCSLVEAGLLSLR